MVTKKDTNGVVSKVKELRDSITMDIILPINKNINTGGENNGIK